MIDGPLGYVSVDSVDGAIELETFTSGQIPQKLIFLAEEEGNLSSKNNISLPGDVAEDTGGSAAGMKQTGEHLEGGGLACAVGPEKSH